MKIKLDTIRSGRYFDAKGQEIIIDCSEVKRAIKEGNFEKRPMQAKGKEIVEEWKKAKTSDEVVMLQRKYHINRVADLCQDGSYKGPVVICKHTNPLDEIIDGGHRVSAAKCMGESEIDVIKVDLERPFTRDDKLKIIDQIVKHNGDSIKALESLSFKYEV